MYCTQCGMELPEEANVCSRCGAKVDKPLNLKNIRAYTGQKARQASANIQDKYQEYKEDRNKAAEDKKNANPVSDMFARPDEQQIMIIEGNYIRNLFSGAGLSREVGVITDRRLYYRGNNYSSSGSVKVDCTVDLQDITSTGFCYTSSLRYVVLAVIHFVVGVILTLLGIVIESEPGMMIGCIVLLFGGLWLLIYYLSKTTIYTITYGGGSLGMNVSFFGLNVIRVFDKNLHIAKEEHLKKYYQYGRGSD